MKERVRKEEEKGVTAAAALFLDAVLQLEAEGWLRGFLDALVATGRFPLTGAGSPASPFPRRKSRAERPRQPGAPGGGSVVPGPSAVRSPRLG